MTEKLRKSIDVVIKEAKALGHLEAEADFADAMLYAYGLLRVYGLVTGKDNSRTSQTVLMEPAKRLWDALRKISPDLEIPVYLDRYQERVDEARLEASSIMQEQTEAEAQ